MDIEYWDNGNHSGMGGMVESWQSLDTGKLNVKMVPRDQSYIDYLWQFTNAHHQYNRTLRTIVKIGDKYIFFDSTDRARLAAESWKLPFDLIVKFQYNPNHPGRTYDNAKAPITPFVYTMRSYNMDLINHCWKKRQETLRTRTFATSMYWAGKIGTNRNQRTLVDSRLRAMKYAHTKRRPYDKYLLELASTQCGVAVAGTGDFTHRDIELMSVGSAFVRKTFNNQTKKPRIPNVHYYSIGGDEVGISGTLKHFCNYFEPNGEFRDFTDEEWTQYCQISHNAKKWWDENASPQGSFNLFRQILEEHNII